MAIRVHNVALRRISSCHLLSVITAYSVHCTASMWDMWENGTPYKSYNASNLCWWHTQLVQLVNLVLISNISLCCEFMFFFNFLSCFCWKSQVSTWMRWGNVPSKRWISAECRVLSAEEVAECPAFTLDAWRNLGNREYEWIRLREEEDRA